MYETYKNYKGALELGQQLMRFPYGSWHYLRGEKIFGWAANRIREEQKVVVEPPAVGSLEEKVEHDAWLDSVN